MVGTKVQNGIHQFNSAYTKYLYTCETNEKSDANVNRFFDNLIVYITKYRLHLCDLLDDDMSKVGDTLKDLSAIMYYADFITTRKTIILL